MLKKNDLIQLRITSATAEGSGVGRTEDGLAVFVPMSAIGDELTKSDPYNRSFGSLR